MVYMYHSFPIHSSSADGHLGCFHVLAMINSAACVIQIYCYMVFYTPVYLSFLQHCFPSDENY